jgi:predicted small secreted protein
MPRRLTAHTSGKGKIMKALIALMVVASFALGGCNTIAGAGKDIEQGGDKIHDTAKDAQDKM